MLEGKLKKGWKMLKDIWMKKVDNMNGNLESRMDEIGSDVEDYDESLENSEYYRFESDEDGS